MFQFRGFATSSSYLQYDRFPHSDINGLAVVCTYPSLFAAYHVLRRLREPRHPPYALISLPFLRLFQCILKYTYKTLLFHPTSNQVRSYGSIYFLFFLKPFLLQIPKLLQVFSF